jgi:hypothetical protein
VDQVQFKNKANLKNGKCTVTVKNAQWLCKNDLWEYLSQNFIKIGVSWRLTTSRCAAHFCE